MPVVGEGRATAALANAQIHALSTNVHYAGKYYYEGEREIRYGRATNERFCAPYEYFVRF